MKKILFCLLAASILVISPVSLAAQRNEPVYLNGLFAGPYICEFAVNGPRRELIREVEPFLQNGRLYFFDFAFPVSSGNLRPGFEFNLDHEDEFIEKPRILAVYRGQARGSLPSDIPNGIPVAGYAERGSITITHVFFTWEEAENWGYTVQLAF